MTTTIIRLIVSTTVLIGAKIAINRSVEKAVKNMIEKEENKIHSHTN